MGARHSEMFRSHRHLSLLAATLDQAVEEARAGDNSAYVFLLGGTLALFAYQVLKIDRTEFLRRAGLGS